MKKDFKQEATVLGESVLTKDHPAFAGIVSLLEDLGRQIHAAQNEHKNVVEMNAFLRQRPDLPVDRIPAYRELVKVREELELTKQKLTFVQTSYTSLVNSSQERWEKKFSEH